MTIPDNNYLHHINDGIDVVAFRLILQHVLTLSNVSKAGSSQNRIAQVERLRMLALPGQRAISGAHFHRGVTAIGVHHPSWRALAYQVLGALLQTDDGLVLFHPSDNQMLIAEAMGPAPASIVNPAPERPPVCKPAGIPTNCNDGGRAAVQSIIMTCPDVSSLDDADHVAARADTLRGRGWRVLILCDDATMLWHRHPKRIDQVLQTRGITPWLLKKICQKGDTAGDVYNLGFLAAITPDHLRQSWKRGMTWAELRILLEAAMFREKDTSLLTKQTYDIQNPVLRSNQQKL